MIIFFLLCLFWFWKFQIPSASWRTNLQRVQIGDQTLKVETAKTTSQITIGLGERDAIGSDGMLFVLPERSIPSFWMKGMRFDLDFVWIDANTVVDLTANVSAQKGVAVEQLKLYRPNQPVTQVLELPAGEIARRGIGIGDAVSY